MESYDREFSVEKNFKRAAAWAEDALKICPDSISCRVKYVEALAKSGDTQTALKKCTDYQSELNNNPDFLYVRGLALCYDGQV
jgi:predicted Zn-dependent protease